MTRTDRIRRTLAVLLPLAFLASGCASMPSEGEVTKVRSSQRAEHESRVRVYGVSPQKGEDPQDIVRGFLEATTSDEPDFATAEEYLTEEAAEEWDPFAGTTVVEGGPTTGPARADGDDYSVQVSGERTARLDSRHAYASERSPFTDRFHLREVKGEGWRIDRLSDGLVLGESDFERIYRSVDIFFFARLGPDARAVSRGRDVLVAHPVYVRSRIAPIAETVRALLQGPTDWLDPVVSTAFPEGIRLAHGGSVGFSDSGKVRVRLNRAVTGVGEERCERMAAQVFHSVQSQASAALTNVELQGPRGRQACSLGGDEAKLYAPGRLGSGVTQPYLIDQDGRVASIEAGTRVPNPVAGPLGSGVTKFRSVGVSLNQRQAAAVSFDGTGLYVAPVVRGDRLPVPVLTSGAVRERDRLSAPSWDGLGDLWVADRDPREPRLLRLRGGRGEPEEVSVPGLGRKERIESLRIATDGVRIALRVKNPDGSSSLKLGRVERHGTFEHPSTSVAALQPVAPQLEDVVAMSWAGHSELVVVGKESRGVQQLQYVGTDGSTAHQPPLPGINDVRSVAASELEGKPLLARSRFGLVRLPANETDWETVAEDAHAPVYPG
ncbi:LpqB family beta-propeller domain-containing protein [Streptomyces sp. TR06-5]|uniref:LpqB family beta-propeller domain-containing protein n=1 Tax=unclassified Streptomyces TaxID=2593676 RepID=UPI0039A287D5